MQREYIFICNLTCLFFFLLCEGFFVSQGSGNDYSKGCAYLRCENGSRCVKRRFWCKDPPCPGMLYCYKSRKELLKGPSTCDTVRCNKGYICVVKMRGCHWDEKCKQQIARCISEKEYFEGPSSCADFKCSRGKRCILREIYCVNPPCKLIRSCENAREVQIWFNKCKNLNCTSEYECFLRRPESNCFKPRCKHTPDCTFTIEDELISKYCYGWICPQKQKCVVRIVDTCKGFNCHIERSCRTSSALSVKHNTTNEMIKQSSNRKTLAQIEKKLENRMDKQMNYSIIEEKPIVPITSMRKDKIHHTTPITHETKGLIHQQIITKEPNLIIESFEPITAKIDESKMFQSSSFLATSSADEKIELNMSRDKKILKESRKIYIMTDDALPLSMMLENINIFGQGYPIWIKNDPHRLPELKDENGWNDVSQEPYKVLLPPYEPVILIEGMGRREQFLPFFTDADFDYYIEGSRTDSSTLTVANNKPANYTNGSIIVNTENIKTDYFNNSSYEPASSREIEKTITTPLSIREELDSYYDKYELRPWYMIHDYLERNEPQSTNEQGSKSNIVDLVIDNFYSHGTSINIKTSMQSQIEKKSQIPETLYVDERNKNLTPLKSSASMERNNYNIQKEKLDSANPDMIFVDHIDKLRDEYEISDISREGHRVYAYNSMILRSRFLSGNYLATERTFSYHSPRNRRLVTPIDNKRGNDRMVYDNSSHEYYDNIGSMEMTSS